MYSYRRATSSYGGGYFEFDMFIPSSYPHSPPKVKFLTTGGGSVRFNPNLYNCGKVCLSILNTWSTNQWSSSSSTISQVLLSIFSMIFIEHPYTNEPAYYDALNSDNGRSASKRYNDKVLANCARVAITGQINNTSTPFVDIIQKHWLANKEKTVEAYAKHGITIDMA
jgi:ubiquitin-protein ligase